MYKLIIQILILFCALLASGSIAVGADSAGSILIDDFEAGLSGWEEKQFLGQTTYSVVAEGINGHVLHALSSGSASGLIKEYSYSAKDYPLLTWRWKVSRTLTRGNARSKEGDDYAARVYVIFPHWLKPLTRSINYIWANQLAVGESVPNTFFSRAIMVAVESGDEKVGQWLVETRNVLEDYRRLFGEDPPMVGGIAIMTDTDNTGEQAQAWYDDIWILPSNHP